MRPIFYDYPDALNGDCDRSLTFALGRSLLIAGPPKPESPATFDICLPKGGWYDYWTGLPIAQAKLTQSPQLDVLPVFVRAGTILPRQPVVQSTSETPRGPLRLDVYPGEDCRGELYLDDGVSISGPSLRQEIRCVVTPRGVVLNFGPRSGSFRPWWKEISVTLHGWNGTTARLADGRKLPFDANARTVSFTIPDQAGPKEFAIAAN